MAGPFPPSPDAAASAALRTVQELLREGHAVEVISPVPSAAERHGPLAGMAGAIALARRARSFDALHLQVGRGLLFRPVMAVAAATAGFASQTSASRWPMRPR